MSEEFLKKNEVQKVVSSDIDCRLKDQRSNLPSEEELYYRKREEELLLQFSLSDHQFLAQQSHSAVYAVAQHIADGEENRLIVFDDAAVGRDVDFAIAESVECIHRFI